VNNDRRARSRSNFTPTMKAINFEAQVNANRKLLKKLPEHCNFSYVWVPAIQDYTIQVVWQALDSGVAVQDYRQG